MFELAQRCEHVIVGTSIYQTDFFEPWIPREQHERFWPSVTIVKQKYGFKRSKIQKCCDLIV